MMAVDPLEVMIAYLESVSDVTDLCAGRIYGGPVPRDEVRNMPRKVVTIRESGGIETNDAREIASARMDVRSYGETYKEAGKLDLAVYAALKEASRVTQSSALLHSVGLSGGPVMARDATTQWPYKWRSCTVIISTVEVS